MGTLSTMSREAASAARQQGRKPPGMPLKARSNRIAAWRVFWKRWFDLGTYASRQRPTLRQSATLLALLAIWIACAGAIATFGTWLSFQRRGGRGQLRKPGEYLLATSPPNPAGTAGSCLAATGCDAVACDLTVQPCDAKDPSQRWYLSAQDDVHNRRVGVSIAPELSGHGRATGIRGLGGQTVPAVTADTRK